MLQDVTALISYQGESIALHQRKEDFVSGHSVLGNPATQIPENPKAKHSTLVCLEDFFKRQSNCVMSSIEQVVIKMDSSPYEGESTCLY